LKNYRKMVTLKQKRQMLDYLVSKLDESNGKVESKNKEFLSGLKSNYVLIGENGIILLVDQEYPDNSFDKLYAKAKREKSNVVAVVFKDRKTFFRSAAQTNYFKKNDRLSLKHYSDHEIGKMILCRPEEIFLINERRGVQYYQPRSDRLEEAIETFQFKPVRFDYSPVDPKERFKPENKDSKRLHIWAERCYNDGPLVLSGGYLRVPQTQPTV